MRALNPPLPLPPPPGLGKACLWQMANVDKTFGLWLLGLARGNVCVKRSPSAVFIRNVNELLDKRPPQAYIHRH